MKSLKISRPALASAALGLTLLSFAATPARADGFTCDNPGYQLRAKIQNHVLPQLGTRRAAYFVVSDRNAPYGFRTLFKATNVGQSGIAQAGAFYTIDTAGGDAERRIGDLYAAQIDRIQVLVTGFNFNDPNKDGRVYPGALYLFSYARALTAPAQIVPVDCVYRNKD